MLRSIIITVSVSLGIAIFLTNFNIVFWTSVIFVTVLQVVVWNIFTYHNNTKIVAEARQLDEKFIEEMAKQQAELPCSYCNTINTADIRLDEDNDFKCSSCNKTNAVYVEIETAQKTEPVSGELVNIIKGDE